MRKQFTIAVLGLALVILLCAAASNPTFAWLSDKAMIAVEMSGVPKTGSVTINLKAEAYTKSDDSSVQLDSTYSMYPAAVYPGDIVGRDGRAIPNARSGIRYTVSNPSGRDVIARVNQKGVQFSDVSPANPKVSHVEFRIYQIHSDYLENNELGPDFKTPAVYLKHSALKEAGFIPYDISQLDFYSQSALRFPQNGNGEDTIGLSVSADIQLEDGVQLINYSGTQSAMDPSQWIFLYLPAGKTASFTYEFTVNPIMSAGNPGVNAFNNLYQYAVLTLQLSEGKDASGNFRTDENGSPLLEAYALEPSNEACKSFFGEDAANQIKAAINSVLRW
ncbi:MAG: hypothetical protein LBT44_02375 [Clostridiales bacterium]|nr:hypothetical protein [Clostridiales bacterium]